MPKHINKKVVASNRKARFNYDIKKTYLAGIVLRGYEVKSCINGQINIKNSYVRINKGEAWLINSHITKWKFASLNDYDPERKRKLLLTASEIRQLSLFQNTKKMSIIPLKVFLIGSRIKVKIGVGKGRKKYDKRAKIREKEMKRDLKEQLGRVKKFT